MNEDATLLEGLLLNKSAKRFCSQCGAEIPEEWDTDEHFGTCPSCKRVNDFVTGIEGRDTWEKEERKRREKNRLMNQYGAYQLDKNGGKTSKIILPNLAQLIMSEHNYNFLTTKDNREIFCYNGSYYTPDGEQKIRNKVEHYLGEDTKEHYKNEVVGYIRDANYVDRNIFNQNVNFINLKNGIYDIDKKELMPHSPDYHFLNEVPVNYNTNADCPNIKKFFESVIREKDIRILQELFGYCLYRDYLVQKAVMLVGDGSNGKSTAIRLLKKMLGENNVSSVSLKALDDNRFSCASLYGKLANLYVDLPSSSLYQTGKFKMLTGGDLIEAEKKHKDAFKFTNYAKLIFSANKVPESGDETEAFFRRWVIITFPYRFVDEESEVDDETIFRKDPKILDAIATEKEMEGLLKRSLEGLERLLKNGKFSYSKTTEEIMDYYQRLSNPVTAFVKDEIEINPDCFIMKDDLYEVYKDYAQRKNLDILPKQIFTKKLQPQPIPLEDYRPKVQGKRPRCWKGIRYVVDEAINNYITQGEEVDEQRRLKT